MDWQWTLLLASIVLLDLPTVQSIQWTSSSWLPDGQYLHGCRGQDLDLLWGFTEQPGETYVDTEWYFASAHSRQEKLIAYKIGDSFMVTPSAPVTVREANGSLWNGGIVITNVTPHNNGRYTIKVLADHSSTINIGETQTVVVDIGDSPVLGPNGFQAEIVADSVRETPSGELHVQLACGPLTHLGHPPVSVLWKTPQNTTVNSTSQHNGTFYLDIDEPHPDGVYSCYLPPSSPSLSCIEANSTLREAQTVTVREKDLRGNLTSAQPSSVAGQNANLTQLVAQLMGQMQATVQASAGLVAEVQQLKEQQARLEADRVNMTSQMDNLTKEVDRLRTENGQLQQANTDLTAQLQNFSSTLGSQAPYLDDYVALPQNCQDVRHYNNTDGLHTLFTRGRVYHAFCDQTTNGGGWTELHGQGEVIQRRMDGAVDFFRDWRDYENGIGNVEGEYWLGLEKLYWLTSSNTYKLRVQMTHYDGSQATALYSAFSVSDAAHNYALRVSGYFGNAGDSLRLNNHRGFTTLDRDNDLSSGNCAIADHGGFWYGDCTNVNINGRYYRTSAEAAAAGDDGMYWYDWKSNTNSLKSVVMMVKAV